MCVCLPCNARFLLIMLPLRDCDAEPALWFISPSVPCSHLSAPVYLFWLGGVFYADLQHRRSAYVPGIHTVEKTYHRNAPLKLIDSQYFTGPGLDRTALFRLIHRIFSNQVCSRMDRQPLPRKGEADSFHPHPGNGGKTSG